MIDFPSAFPSRRYNSISFSISAITPREITSYIASCLGTAFQKSMAECRTEMPDLKTLQALGQSMSQKTNDADKSAAVLPSNFPGSAG